MRARVYAYVAGALLLLLGTLGFLTTGFSGFVEADSGDVLLGLRLNPTLNLVHLALGAAWLWAGASEEPLAGAATGLVGAVLVALGVGGLWLTGRPDLNVLAVNRLDNLVHVLVGGLGVLAVLSRGSLRAGARSPRQARETER